MNQNGTTLIELLFTLIIIIAVSIAMIVPNITTWCPIYF